MKKICDRCWLEDTSCCDRCDDFSEFVPTCESCYHDEAMYDLDGKMFCSNCILKQLGIEQVEISSYEFYFNDEYLGNDNDDEIIMLKNVNKNVKELEY